MNVHHRYTQRPAHIAHPARLARLGLVAAGALALGACATIPKPLVGAYSPITPQQAAQGSVDGTPVRWGGEIIKTEPQPKKTCFFMLSRPLDSTARPIQSGPSLGRFVACHSGFYDPKIFAPGREVTFTGTLNGSVSKMVGKFDYAYPRLKAKTIYRWPRLPDVVAYPVPMYPPMFYPPGFYNPFWGPPGYLYFGGSYGRWHHHRRHH